jgi:hypothetical protein
MRELAEDGVVRKGANAISPTPRCCRRSPRRGLRTDRQGDLLARGDQSEWDIANAAADDGAPP